MGESRDFFSAFDDEMLESHDRHSSLAISLFGEPSEFGETHIGAFATFAYDNYSIRQFAGI